VKNKIQIPEENISTKKEGRKKEGKKKEKAGGWMNCTMRSFCYLILEITLAYIDYF
jgi:hypothetical protein